MSETDSNCLLITPRPFSDECYDGYVLRLADVNGYDRPSWIRQENRFTRGFINETFTSVTQVVPQGYLRSGNSSICPYCLREIAYIRTIWSLIPVTSCPKHNCMLVDTCPACRKKMTFNRSKISKCKCDYDLRNAEVPSISESETEFARHIESLCGTNGKIFRKEGLSPLYNLDLARLLRLIVFTGSYLRDLSLIKKRFQISTCNIEELHALLSKAYSFYQAWPHNYHHFGDHLRAQRRTVKESTGFKKDFGKYPFYLYKNFADPQYAFVRKAFEDYVATSWTGGYIRSYSHVKDALLQSKYVTARKAAELLKIKHQRIPDLVSNGLLRGDIREMGSKTLCLVEKNSLREMQACYKECLNLNQVARSMGTATKNVVALISNNSLKALGPAPRK